MTTPRRPAIFVHGLWLHASSWDPWLEKFQAAGYDASAPAWPGDGETVAASRENPNGIAGRGVDEVVEHYAQIIATLPQPPVLVGHSFGGTIVEKLMGQSLGAAGIAIDAAPIKGVLPLPISSLRAAFPALQNPANRNRAVSLTPDQFQYAFGNAISPEESAELYEKWTIPAPGKPLFQAATANFSAHAETKVDTDNDDRGPLLLIMGAKTTRSPRPSPSPRSSSTGTAPPSPTSRSSPTEVIRSPSTTVGARWLTRSSPGWPSRRSDRTDHPDGLLSDLRPKPITTTSRHKSGPGHGDPSGPHRPPSRSRAGGTETTRSPRSFGE